MSSGQRRDVTSLSQTAEIQATERQVGTRKERKNFSAAEDETIMDYFKCSIIEQRTPPLAVCRQFLEECSTCC